MKRNIKSRKAGCKLDLLNGRLLKLFLLIMGV